MTKEELIKGINDCGVKKKDIEERLGMPKNSLSGMLSGSKPISEKWFGLLEGFLSEDVTKSGTENEPKSEVLINEEVELQKHVSSISVNSALKQVQEEEKQQKTEPKPLLKTKDNSFDDTKSVFQNLIIEFNKLIEDKPLPNLIKAQISALIEKSQHPELTARQSEAIRARCINYLTGQYGTKSKK